ncbi:MAG: glycosyltransferase, partial [Alphaproteobacteria bacterium]|nr:glycosyltransferase [Alphaproteobacteria bacterium]
MSIWRQALRRDRLSRFVDVARREGLPRALGKARAHVRLIRSGQGTSSVPYLSATVGGRFARTALWADLAKGEAFHASAAPAVLSRRRSVALIGDLNLPQCRKYRVEQMVEIWSQLGVAYRYAHVEDVPRCLDILQDASHVVLYRLQASDFLHMYLYEARRLKLPVAYDIDDPIFSASALAGYSNIHALGQDALAHAVAQAPLYLSALSMADAVSVATPGLAEHLAGFTARPIWLRRNFIDAPAHALGGIPSYLINLPAGRSFAEHYQNPAVDAAIARIAAFAEPDLAHLHCIQELGAGAIGAVKELGLPVIVSVHDHWWLCERQFMLRPDGRACGQNPVRLAGCGTCVDDLARTRARRDALRTALAQADLVTYPSAHALRLGVASGFAPETSVLWENGVRLPGPGFAALQAARRARDGRWTLGFLGGPSAMKGWPLCRDAIIGLGPRDIRGLVVDGSLDGSWWRPADLERLPGVWQIEPRFEPHDLDRVFARIDVLLFLSQWPETYGLVVREALARGVRVVQTGVGGAAEHGGAGLATILSPDAGPGDVTEALSRIVH